MKATSCVACGHRIGDAASGQMIDMPPGRSHTWVSKVSSVKAVDRPKGSRFNIVQLWFKQDFEAHCQAKTIADFIPPSCVPRTPKSLYENKIFWVADISE